ncbi:MAG: hypothetical protein WCJ35_20530 [Planctomycetota bacterium]
MCRSGMKFPVCASASIAILLAVIGCAEFHPPRIDPSGEHLFISNSPLPAAVPCPPGTTLVPVPAAPGVIAPAPPSLIPIPAATARPPVAAVQQVSPYSDVAVMLSPFSTVMPVGSQRVLLGGVRGGDGYLRTNRRLEWWLVPGSVGQFTGIGENRFTDFLVGDFTRPRVVSSTFAIGSTTRVAERAGGPDNTVFVARGQGWVTVSSPVEGISHVTVVAPDVVVPAERTKSAIIYWIDAQFGFPTPAITPAGTKQSLTTTVWRQSNHCPRPGWIVRYEVACGPPVVFGPAGTTSIEVPTNEGGQASVEIFQKDPSPGTNQVRIQVFRPADQCGQRLMVREDSVLVTWTAPSLGIRQMGPPTATIGETITYRIEVSNPGDLPAREVVATEEVPDGLSFLQSNPAPVVEGRRLQWRLGDLAPRQQQIIEATFRTTQPGIVSCCIEVAGSGGLHSIHCAKTNVLAALPGPAIMPGPTTIPSPAIIPAPAMIPNPGPGPTRATTPILELKVMPETLAVVGSNVTFDIDLTNRGLVPATGVVIRDTFGDGLEHQQRSPIMRPVSDLAPGQSIQFGVTFRVTRPGELCHRVEATANDGARAATDSCITAIAAAVPPAGGSPPISPVAIPGRLDVRVDNLKLNVPAGENQRFMIQVTNQGDYAENDVVVTVRIPPGTAAEFGTTGPNANIKYQVDQELVRFDPVAELPPKAMIDYRVVVRTSKPGPISLQVEATSRRQTRPAVGEKTVEVLPKE